MHDSAPTDVQYGASRISIKTYFIGFARKFYPSLIYKQIKFQLFLQILQFWDIQVYWNIVFKNETIFAGLKFAKSIEI